MKTGCNYYALDDIGFVGVPNQRHTEEYFAEIGRVIAKIRGNELVEDMPVRKKIATPP